MIVAIFVFAPVGLPAWYILLATRVIGVPLVAGLSFELIKFAGRNRGSGWVQAIIWPGMQLQKLTTREPDDEQVEVAIAALEAVLAVEDPARVRRGPRGSRSSRLTLRDVDVHDRVPGRADRGALRRGAGADVAIPR